MAERFGLSVSEGKVHRMLAENGMATAVQDRAVSDRYVTVDPVQVLDKFSRSGMEPVLFEAGMGLHGRRRRHSNPTSWNKILQVKNPSERSGEFNGFMRILFNHEGRRSILFQPGLVYCACENQFLAPVERIRHDDQQRVEDFLSDPAGFVLGIWNRIERLHDLRGGLGRIGDGQRLLSVLAGSHFRVYSRAMKFLSHRYGNTFCGALDSATNTHTTIGDTFARRCLEPDVYGLLASGRVPDGLALEFTNQQQRRQLAACAQS